ncbi:MAG: transporter related protein [Acidimicrobiaceae bacterium]|nr:transporter related protein [Acidimicrobiaceae bacterium]
MSLMHATPPSISTKAPFLELRGVQKRYGSVTALRGIDLTVAAGEVVAVVGDNGAGKSTLIKTIAGTHRADGGSILIEGREVRIHSPQSAAALGVATVYQDLALCENLDVVSNLFLGRELARRPFLGELRRLNETEMERVAAKTLASLSIKLPSLRRPVAMLSGGQRQAVAVSRALLWGSKLVMLDEPTAALGVTQTAHVLELVRRLADNGQAVLLISHNLPDVFAVADRICVIRLGENAGTFARTSTTAEEIVAAMTGGRTVDGAR